MKKEMLSQPQFKKIIIVVVIFIVVVLSSKKVNNFKTGDVNGDGKVSNVDLVLVQRHILDMEKLTGLEKIRADTNNDGKVDIVDLANIQKIILGVD